MRLLTILLILASGFVSAEESDGGHSSFNIVRGGLDKRPPVETTPAEKTDTEVSTAKQSDVKSTLSIPGKYRFDFALFIRDRLIAEGRPADISPSLRAESEQMATKGLVPMLEITATEIIFSATPGQPEQRSYYRVVGGHSTRAIIETHRDDQPALLNYIDSTEDGDVIVLSVPSCDELPDECQKAFESYRQVVSQDSVTAVSSPVDTWEDFLKSRETKTYFRRVAQ